MRKPSRNMPPYEPTNDPLGITSWLFIIGLLSVFAYLIWQEPWLLVIAPMVFSVSYFDNKRRIKKLAILLDERKEYSLCEFSRSFERHKVDTWIIRAVYEQIQEYVSFLDVKLPLKATDDIFELLEIDSEEFDIDILEEVSQRTGRSMENAERNPFYGKVQTLEDLVLYFNEQPLS